MIYICGSHPSTRVSSYPPSTRVNCYPISRKLFLLLFQSTKISVDRLTDLVQRLSVRHAPVKGTARLRCALLSNSKNDGQSFDIYINIFAIFFRVYLDIDA